MLTVLTALALGALGYLSAAVVRERGAPVRSVFTLGWCAAAAVAPARPLILYGGPLLLLGIHHSPPTAILLLILIGANCGFEMSIARRFVETTTPFDPSLLIASLVVATSIPLGFVWAWIRARPRTA